MKKQITLLSLLISSLTICSAQPTLTHSGTAPQTGISGTSHYGSFVNQGSSGANQTWNFGTFSGPTTNAFALVTPVGTPFEGAYPTSNVCSYVSSASSYEYIEDNSSASYVVGAESPSVSMDYTADEQKFLIYPLTYNGTWTDAYQVAGDAGAPFTRTGSSTFTADAWGTLTTPNGTYTNVLRVHESDVFTDDFGFATYNGTQETYYWYKDGVHYPIFVTATSTYNGNPASSQAYYNDAPSGIDEQATLSASVYPTLASSEIFVTFGINNSGHANYELMDIAGRKILAGALSQQLNAINVENINPGNYLLKIFSEDAVLTRKVMIQ